MPRSARPGASVAIAALLALAACGGGDDSPTVGADPGTPTTVSGGPTTTAGAPTTRAAPAGTVLAATIRGGSVVDGASRQRATLGQPVTVRITSDVADSVHVHGYDRFVDVTPGRPGEVIFVANIPGVFEVEFERSGKLLFTMEVR